MATPDQIPSDLALEINDGLTPDQFLSVIRNFLGYVEKVAKFVAPSGGADDWLVRVKEGSNLIILEPGARADTVPVRTLYRAIEGGIRAIEDGDLKGAKFPDPALAHLRALSQMSGKDRTRNLQLRVWVERRPFFLGERIAQTIEEDWRANYKDYGSVEGDLDAIQDRRGLHIRVRDALLRQAVQCVVPEELLAEVFASFRKRVEVYGVIHFRKNGSPISINVERIVQLPSDDTLPSLNDVRGLLSDQVWLS